MYREVFKRAYILESHGQERFIGGSLSEDAGTHAIGLLDADKDKIEITDMMNKMAVAKAHFRFRC